MLYLHEIIDIVGTGQEAYMQTVAERARHSAGQGISRLVGCWKVIGSTNRWPRVVNLWEMDSWQHWAQTLERQFLPEKKDAGLAPWWAKATEWRSGGFDRILEPAAFSPTREDLLRSGLRSWVCIHTILRTVRGRAGAYLDELAAAAPAADGGVQLFGAYRSIMRSDEIVVIWAAPDFEHACKLFERSTGKMFLMPLESEWLSEFETMWLVPGEECFFYPGNRSK